MTAEVIRTLLEACLASARPAPGGKGARRVSIDLEAADVKEAALAALRGGRSRFMTIVEEGDGHHGRGRPARGHVNGPRVVPDFQGWVKTAKQALLKEQWTEKDETGRELYIHLLERT